MLDAMINFGFKFQLLKVSTEMKKKNKLEQSLASCLCLCLSTSLKPKFQPNSSENYSNLINILREVPQTGGGQQNYFLFFSWEFFDEWLFPAKYSEHTWLCKSVSPQGLPPRSHCVKRVADLSLQVMKIDIFWLVKSLLVWNSLFGW